MRRISKTIWLLLAIISLAFGLVSCKKPDNGKEEPPAVVDDDVIYSPYIDTTIVLGEGIDSRDVNSLRTTYYKKVGKEISVSSAESTPLSHEIIVGKTDRELSKKAYNYLTRFKDDNKDAGYVIYSDGKSVAIAFDNASYGENIAFIEAIEEFVSEYMQTASLKFDAGAVCHDFFDSIDRQEARDEEISKRLWDLKLSQITAKVDGNEELATSIFDELQSLQYIYNDKYSIVEWIANLYDPEIGGFYYSNSARNNQGYLPDLQSTSQALGIVESILTGYGGTLTDYFGEEIAEKFVSFAKNMQDPNGYFYHPQWSKGLTDNNLERRTIDVLAALNIMELFGATPTYDTYNGVKGEGAVTPASRLTLPLADNGVASVSKVVSTSDSEIYIPPHLRSQSAFSTYLNGLDIRGNTSAVCNTLLSEMPLYKAVDKMLEENGEKYRLSELICNYLNQNQNDNTGLWSSSNKVTFEEIEEISDVIKVYDALGECALGYGSIFATINNYLNFEEEPTDISYISGAWTSLAAVVNNITTYGDKIIEDEINDALSFLYSGFDITLKRTRTMLLKFLREDGSFSTTPSGSADEQFGMTVALPLMDEGDMNATLLAAKNTWLSVFRVLGVGDVPIFGTTDRMMFSKTLLDLGVIVKNEIKSAKPEDFESFNIGETSNAWLFSKFSEGRYLEVVEGPEGMGHVLKLYSSDASGQDEFHFDAMSTVKGATCYVYDLDMCISSESSQGLATFMVFYKYLHCIRFERDGNTIKLIEGSNQWEAPVILDLDTSVQVDEWFNLRVEYYPGNADTVRSKIFLNGECIAVTDNYFNKDTPGTVPPSNYEGLAIFAKSSKVMSTLVDNVMTESNYMTYVPETSSSLKYNVDTPDSNQIMHDFEQTAQGSIPVGFKPVGEASSIGVKKDNDGNNVLSFSEKVGELILPLDQRGSAPNSAIVEFDFTVSTDSAVGAKYQINFNEYLYEERNLASIQLQVIEEGGNKYVAVAEALSGTAKEPYSHVKLSLGVKYRLRLQLFFEQSAMVVSVDGDIIGISENVMTDCWKLYMGETSIMSMSPSVPSTILIDNLISERVSSDFDEMTAPNIPRKDYNFDSTEDMVIGGVSPSDGKLSFEGASGSSYVKIPVNVRVNVPLVNLAGLDVSTTESGNGELIIAFTDSSDNFIFAFALVRNGADVDIYEYTKNGRYPRSIYTVSESSFSISIEYSSGQDRDRINLFVNGEYAVSSSLLYKDGSSKNNFEYLRVGTVRGSAGFAVDNLYAEKTAAVFKTYASVMPNTDESDRVMTYETSNFASMPSSKRLELSLGSSKTYLTIKESFVNNAVTKVLEFYSSGAAGDIIIFKRTQTESGTNAAFYETDMMLKSTGDVMRTLMQFRASWNGSYPTVYNIVLETNGPGAPLTVKGGKTQTTEPGTDFNTTLNNVKEGEWFKIRVEYVDTPYDYNYDGLQDCIVRVYINGTLAGEGSTANNLNTIPPASAMVNMRFTVSSGIEGSVFFDNTALGQCTMTYEEPVPADTDTITYTPGIITNKTQPTLGTNSSASISSITVGEEVNKVLKLYSAIENKDKLTVSPTVTLETANAISFETDIMINPETDTATFYLEPANDSGKPAFRLTINATKGGNVTMSSLDIPETVIGTCGEWIHIKVEYMNPYIDYTGDRILDILYKVYIKGASEPVAKGYAPYNSSSYYDPLALTKFVFTIEKDTVSEILFDNTRFWQVELEPDVAPEFPDSGDNSHGNTGSDGSGWT